MRAVRIPLFVLLAVLFFILWTTCGRTFKAICTSSSPMKIWMRPKP